MNLSDLVGRIDQLLETEDAVAVQDFQNVLVVVDDYLAEDQSEQMLLYGDVVRRLVPGKRVRLRFVVVTKAKTPEVLLLEAMFDESELDRTNRVSENVWPAIQSGYLNPSPYLVPCPGCGYRSQCAAWRG